VTPTVEASDLDYDSIAVAASSLVRDLKAQVIYTRWGGGARFGCTWVCECMYPAATHMHTCIRANVYVFSTYARMRGLLPSAHVLTCIHIYLHMYLHAYTHKHTHTGCYHVRHDAALAAMHHSLFVCVCVYICAYVSAGACVCARVCVRV